jgi:hypothetical protein
LCVTATGISGAAVTATLPLVVGQFHYITSIRVSAYNVAARTGSATPVVVTTTNLPGTPAFTFGSAGAIGTIESQQVELGGNRHHDRMPRDHKRHLARDGLLLGCDVGVA